MKKKVSIELELIKLVKSTHVGGLSQNLNARCLGLRRVRNYATGFHNFCKIVPLRSVPHNQAKPTTNP